MPLSSRHLFSLGTNFFITMSQNSATYTCNHILTLFLPLCLRETSGHPNVSLNAKTNGNRWKQGLGCELDGCHLHSGDIPSLPTCVVCVSLISG